MFRVLSRGRGERRSRPSVGAPLVPVVSGGDARVVFDALSL